MFSGTYRISTFPQPKEQFAELRLAFGFRFESSSYYRCGSAGRMAYLSLFVQYPERTNLTLAAVTGTATETGLISIEAQTGDAIDIRLRSQVLLQAAPEFPE